MSNPWVTRDIGAGVVGATRNPRETPGAIDINSSYDGVLVAQVTKKQRKQDRREFNKLRSDLVRAINRVNELDLRNSSKEKAKTGLIEARKAIEQALKKNRNGNNYVSRDELYEQYKEAIDNANDVIKFNRPPWTRTRLRYMLYEDFLEAYKLYGRSVDSGDMGGIHVATNAKINEAVKRYSRASNLLRNVDAKDPPNGNTIRSDSIAAWAWSLGAEYADESKSPRFFYDRLSQKLDARNKKIFLRADSQKRLDQARANQSMWYRALTEALAGEDRTVIVRYLKVLWGRTAQLKLPSTNNPLGGVGFYVAFDKDQVPEPEEIVHPPDIR